MNIVGIVNVAVGLLIPSVAKTVKLPAGLAGTTKVQLNPPVEPVVIDAGEVVCTTLSNSTVMPEDAANPVPVTVTVVPAGPLVGLKLIADVTVKEAVGLLVPSLSCTV
jgi:hypothetical protein